MLKNPSSKVVILVIPIERIVANLFLRIPFEYGFSGIVGKKYEAIKDYLKWNNLDVAYWTPILVDMGIVYASEVNKKS